MKSLILTVCLAMLGCQPISLAKPFTQEQNVWIRDVCTPDAVRGGHELSRAFAACKDMVREMNRDGTWPKEE